MKRFKIYGGLGGGFNEVVYHAVEEHKTEIDALLSARAYAVEMYESYEGLHGLRDISQIIEEDEVDEDEASGIYDEEISDWIDYHVKEVPYGIEYDEDGDEIEEGSNV